MEHLRDGIGLRGYGQRDPKQEYKKEGYDIFINMMAATSSNVATKAFKVKVQRETEIERMEREDLERHARQQAAMQMRHGGEVEGAEAEEQAKPGAGPSRRPPPQAARVSQPPVQRSGPKIGRNDPCPCGSGQKFKKCHGAILDEGDDKDADDATA
jgi:preprotein translocase subunit SecA